MNPGNIGSVHKSWLFDFFCATFRFKRAIVLRRKKCFYPEAGVTNKDVTDVIIRKKKHSWKSSDSAIVASPEEVISDTREMFQKS